MPLGGRKIPFSGKAKKLQLQAKKQNKKPWEDKQRKTNNYMHRKPTSCSSDEESMGLFHPKSKILKKLTDNRYALHFHTETKEELQLRKEEARKSLVPVSEENLEIKIEDYFPPDLSFPKRPPWNYDMAKWKVQSQEQEEFWKFQKEIEEKYSSKERSYFELNLETWRQLWRVLEMSDIVLLIVDARYPALMFPPSLYDYVINTMKKDMILILNKIDLVPTPLVIAWKSYLKEKFPNLHILTFTSYPAYNLVGNSTTSTGLQIRKRKGKLRMAAEGAQKLFNACKDIVKDDVDISSWQAKISEEMTLEYDDQPVEIGETIDIKKVDTSYKEHKKFESGVLRIGCVGQPNVGKSSLINALMGKKVVSVSRTPGHTKHFQTIFLTKSVQLCDCPGLVFPSKVPKVLQVLMGSYPIAQVRDPYTVVKYLAERIDLVKMLKLQHPNMDDEWSADDICDGWALKRKFYTARAARLDTNRAANQLLRFALDGKISLCLRPPGYTKEKEKWENDPEVEAIEWIKAKLDGASGCADELECESSEEEPTASASSVNKFSRESEDSASEGDAEYESDGSDEIPGRSKKFQGYNPLGLKDRDLALLREMDDFFGTEDDSD